MLTALLTLAGLLQVAGSLKIAAFNIRSFGETKMSNATLTSYIVRVSPQGPVPEDRGTAGAGLRIPTLSGARSRFVPRAAG